MDDKEISEKGVKIWALIVLALCAPIYFLVAHLSNPGEARAAALCIGVLLFVLRAFWSLRERLWFWAIIVAVALSEAFLVTRISWSSKDITGPILSVIAIADFILIYGIISVARRMLVRPNNGQ